MAIQDRALLVKLSFSSLTFERKDRKVTDETLARYGVKDGKAGRFQKKLFPHDPLQKLSSHCSVWGTWHHENTRPWLDNGIRIKPACDFIEFVRKSNEYKARAERLRDEFLDGYEGHIEKAEEILKKDGLFDREEYPSKEKIAASFYFDLTFLPFPSSSDFRVKFGEEDMRDLAESLDRKIAKALDDGKKELWRQLLKPVAKMAETLKESDKVFRDTLVENIADVVERLPKLNLEGDEDLDKKVAEVKEKLSALSPKCLRKVPEFRKAAQVEAERLAGILSGYV